MSMEAKEPTVDRDVLVAYVNDYLDADRGSDFCPNGLQIEGRSEIRRVATGVSACKELFDRAIELEADAILVHHGLFWDGDDRTLTGVQYQRVAALIRNEVNLLAYHLPLDRHYEVGNNAMAVSALGLSQVEPFGELDGLSLGFKGVFPQPVALVEVITRCKAIFEQDPLVFDYGPDPVRSLGVISGAASRSLHDAIQIGLDMFLTGEPNEWTMNVAKEAGCHFVAAGHYATERLGIKALGAHLESQFDLEVEFIDVPNPI
jgi:dinuclear metal center YbgI/SA1388 family protein